MATTDGRAAMDEFDRAVDQENLAELVDLVAHTSRPVLTETIKALLINRDVQCDVFRAALL